VGFLLRGRFLPLACAGLFFRAGLFLLLVSTSVIKARDVDRQKELGMSEGIAIS